MLTVCCRTQCMNKSFCQPLHHRKKIEYMNKNYFEFTTFCVTICVYYVNYFQCHEGALSRVWTQGH
jgi:hypothetical protein